MMPNTTFTLRPMLADDLPAILAVQRQCYLPEMNEDGPTWCGRLAAAPGFAWVGERDGNVCAYLATYPSQQGKITPLGGDFIVAAAADCLYFHDLAVAPAAAGSGLGAQLVGHALAAARQQGLAQAALVCVQQAFAFWQRHGFVEQTALTAASQAALATYPGPARYMLRSTV